MITGEIKSQIDRIWDAFWSGGISNLRIPVKVITRSTLNVIIDSTESDRLTERSDAGVRL